LELNLILNFKQIRNNNIKIQNKVNRRYT